MQTVKEKYIQKSRELRSGLISVRTLENEVDNLASLFQSQVQFYGERDYGDGESGISWWLFPAKLTDDEIYKHLIELGIAEDMDRGVFDDNDWDCSGKCLLEAPGIIKRTKTKVLVTRSWAYDV